MSDITTKILYECDIESLGDRYLFLKNADLASSAFSNWRYTNTHELGYKKIKKLNIIFIGQTGYGKSSLINKLIKKISLKQATINRVRKFSNPQTFSCIIK